MSLWNLRLRALLAEQFALVVTVLVVLAAIGGFVTYTAYVSPTTTTEEQVVATWESSGSFDHRATVVRENPVFAVGSELRNRQVYFTDLAPVLNGTYSFSYRASGSGELTTTVEVTLVTRGVEETDGQQQVLWTASRTLTGSDSAAVRPGTGMQVPFSFNASAVAAERDRIEEQLGGGVGTTETFVRAQVAMEGTVNGEQVQRQEVHTLPLTLGRNTYRLGPAETPEGEFETTRQVTVTQSSGPLRSVGGPLLLLVGLAGLVGLVVGRNRYQFELTDGERNRLDYHREREEFEEWITTFQLPPEAFDRPRAEAASLGDLVDLAIDTNTGVVTPPDESAYYVVDGELLYAYVPPMEPTPTQAVVGSGRGDEADEASERDGDA